MSTENRPSRASTGKRLTLTGCALVLAAGGLTAGAASATATENSPRQDTRGAAAQQAKTTCENFQSVYARCSSSSANRTQAAYIERGDKIDIVDRFGNGKSTRVLLHVKGSGIAEFSSKKKQRRVVDKNYTEGKDVRIKVCTSWSKKAKCSSWSGWGAT